MGNQKVQILIESAPFDILHSAFIAPNIGM